MFNLQKKYIIHPKNQKYNDISEKGLPFQDIPPDDRSQLSKPYKQIQTGELIEYSDHIDPEVVESFNKTDIPDNIEDYVKEIYWEAKKGDIEAQELLEDPKKAKNLWFKVKEVAKKRGEKILPSKKHFIK